MTISNSSLMPNQIIQCIATGRTPTRQELVDVAERIWTDGAAGRSAFSWGRLSAGSRDRLIALRFALLALNGSDRCDGMAKACKPDLDAQGAIEFATGRSTKYPDESATVTRQRGKALGLQGPSRRAELALSNFSKQFDGDELHSRFMTAARCNGGQEGCVVKEKGEHQLENFLAIEPDSNRILATATVAIEQRTRIAKAVLVIRPKFEKDGIRWRLLDKIARFAESMGVQTLEAIENRRKQGFLNLECHAGWTATPYRADPTLMVLRRTINGLRG